MKRTRASAAAKSSLATGKMTERLAKGAFTLAHSPTTQKATL